MLDVGTASTPSPKPRGGRDRSSPSPAPQPAPTSTPSTSGTTLSSWRSGAGTSSVPAAAKEPVSSKNWQALVEKLTDTSNDLIINSTPANPYKPGAVSKAEADLASALAEKTSTPLVNSMGLRVSDPAAAERNGFTGTPEEARAALARAEDARRDRATRAGIQGKGVGEVERLTWEQYNNLDPRERAAVDFNTMLVRAVRRDKKLEETYDPSTKEEEKYDETVESMLGPGGGPTPYAPETVAVLKQIGYKDRASDLDDFLDLRSAITARDIKNMAVLNGGEGPSIGEATGSEVQRDRVELTQDLMAGTQAMEAKLVEGNRLLATVTQTATAERNPSVEALGGVAKDPKVMLGFGSAPPGTPEGDIDQYFRDTFETLARKGATPDWQQQLDADFSIIAQNLGDPAMKDTLHQQFQAYVQARSTTAGDYELGLGETKGIKYKTPEQFRAMFGLDDGRPQLVELPDYKEPPAPKPVKQPGGPGHVVQGGGF